MTDRLSLAIAMQDAGIPPAKAEIASVVFGAVHNSMAANIGTCSASRPG